MKVKREYKQGVSIIICFYNAGEKIIDTLQYIKKQENRSSENTELILVNNSSSDNSEEIILNTMKDFDTFTWKIVQENKPGLSNARMCGLNHVSYDLIVFCDDDNWLSSNYLNLAEKIINADSRIGVLGGIGTPVSTVDFPDWFANAKRFYAVGPQMPTTGRVIGVRNVVYGAGMIIRTDVFNEVLDKGFVFQSLGRTGSNLSSGEDSELCLAIQILGRHIYYDESLTFQHFIEPHRISLGYFKSLTNNMDKSGFYGRFYRDYFFGQNIQVKKYFWFKEMIYTFLDLIIKLFTFKFNIRRNIDLILFLGKERSCYDKNVEHILKICKQLQS